MSDRDTPDLARLNPAETAPQDGRQFIAWAVDLHGEGTGTPSEQPIWCVVQWAPPYQGGKPYWRWMTPGRSTAVRILGWLDLPWDDEIGRFWRDAPRTDATPA